MNMSIQTVTFNTTDERVRELCRQLYNLRNRKVRITFRKKNGDVRVMDCVPRNEFNEVMGLETTPVGRRVVNTKALRDMIVVTEILAGRELQPRTVNLRTVIGDIIPLS